ncbi:S-adenosylmethionine:tRNA ribosyltransferase-isomerase [Roseivirga spongicola]|uniref:S-adenosylmethionine:tRNA ribosyltransferase-isomerase n=1 Tax=Roseivirga spongicola TaxID=333140 RepID=A0A150X5X1_9BACT|nr:S-adenosylmethionine:tRNA ribosyltransferase-isomerase [Roseivirga spongicola]KYG74084.1 S-adenosylmethionine tRNA ribosyltransferase [Roseivirga spongicola]WPZ09266.1 S-adenosylmethionine:tRNA ribosyltransferase-isomerase [Roseivirga spongicola]
MAIPPAPDLKAINYSLPDEKIAKYPLAQRDQSKLLTYSGGNISDTEFKNLPEILDANTSLFFNNTKVIPARLFFQKETGAQIEIFLLNPVSPTHIISLMMEETGAVVWECMVGNFKKWKDDTILARKFENNGSSVEIRAKIVDREQKQIEFSWSDKSLSFAEIVELSGKVPLPPYLNRTDEPEDKERYQTVYSKQEGAVAAPTAGLHFTDQVLSDLEQKGVNLNYLTLHVSAGTFQPIKASDAREHNMHSEQVEVNRSTVELLSKTERVVAVGTTSMRTLESLYWFGVRLMNGNEDFSIQKLEPYETEENLPSRKEVFAFMLNWMDENNTSILTGKTEIFIMPGYQFRVCNGLITNFHQPGSTLMLLVWAFIGENWKKVYKHALSNDYRFLSYGDSSILLP